MTAPNILMVMADQLAPQFTGTYGHPLVQTPNLDALAERGVRFDSAYVHSPLCAPARFTMLAGQAVHRIGAWDNASEFPAQVPTLAHYLKLMGYRTVLSGKMHFVGPDQLHGFDTRLTTDIYPADFAWTPDWETGARMDKWYHGMDTLHEAGHAAMTYQIEYDDEVGFHARRQLFDFARDPDDSPFFLCASFIHPHDPYVARPEWWDLYDHDTIDMPGAVPDAVAAEAHVRRIREGLEVDTVGYTEAQARNSRHAYYANVSYFDDWIGQLVATLEETDQLDNTVVIVTSDHGDMLGERGLWFKMAFYEESARVPLVMAGPGVTAGASVGTPCSHLDFLPTLVDIASEGGAAAPELGAAIDGSTLWDAATGGAIDAERTVLGEYCGEMLTHPMFMIRRGDHKYIHCDTDDPLLFDVAADPKEHQNLATDPGHSALATAFAAEVAKRWDSDAIRGRVIESQQVRRLLDQAMSAEPRVAWDHQPGKDAAEQYVRNHMNWFEVGPRTRYP